MSYSPTSFNPATATAASAASGYQNGIGSAIALATPVSTSNGGLLLLTDVTSEASAEGWLGLASMTIPSTAFGQVASDGRIQNIPSGLGFSVGDPIWVGNTPGTLTNVRPNTGTAGWETGYYVLFVGVVVKNEFNPSNQDIQLSRQIIGQLQRLYGQKEKVFDIDRLSREEVEILSIQLGESIRNIYDNATKRANKILSRYNMECKVTFHIQELGSFPEKGHISESANLEDKKQI